MAKRGGQRLGVGGGGNRGATVPAEPISGVSAAMYDELKNYDTGGDNWLWDTKLKYFQTSRANGMTDEEYEAIKSSPTLSTINAYTETGFQVNEYIRNKNTTPLEDIYIRNLNAALESLPIAQTTAPIFRGFKDDYNMFYNVGKGDLLTFNSFTSTSKVQAKAKEFARESDNPVIFVMNSHKTGRDIKKISAYPTEEEILFKTGTNWKVSMVSVQPQAYGNPIKYIYLDEE